MRDAMHRYPLLKWAFIISLAFIIVILLVLFTGKVDRNTTSGIAEAATIDVEASEAYNTGREGGRVTHVLFTKENELRAKAQRRRGPDPTTEYNVIEGIADYRGLMDDYIGGQKVKCRQVSRTARGEIWPFGTDVFRTKLEIRWCWNGTRIVDARSWIFCDVTTPGSGYQWRNDYCNKSGFYKRFQGSDHGAFELTANAHYQQSALGWVVDDAYHRQKICAFRGGGATVC